MQRPKRIDLGPLISTYRGRPLSWRDLFLILLLGVFAVIFPLLYGIWITNYVSMRNGPIAASTWSGPWFILAACSTFCFLLLVSIRVFHHSICVSVYRNGLKINLSPIKRYIITWADIFGITNHSICKHLFGHPVQNQFCIVIVSKDNKIIRLDQRITHITKLAYIIKKYSFQRIFPSLVNDFQNGRWIDFGLLSINKHYFSIQQNRVSWSVVSKIYVKAGWMLIETMDKQIVKIKISQIPNIELLFKLLSRGIGT